MTTERVLPAIALPIPGHTTARDDLARPIERRAAANRNERYFTTPARAGILIGASAAVYAVSLAAVAGLQASDDAALATRRQYEVRLDALAALVAETQGSMAAMPKRIKLPNVTMSGPIAAAATRSSGGHSATPRPKPTTNTRASGG